MEQCGKASAITSSYGGVYHLYIFLMILGLVYYWVYHIIEVNLTYP